MKDHFPFTDYDFYAYLASGGLFLAVVDYIFNGGAYLVQKDWSFIQVAVVVAAAYVIGHIVAMLAQGIFETLIVSNVIRKPIKIQLGLSEPYWLEKVIGILVGRYYAPLPLANRTKILNAAAAELGKSAANIDDAEEVFLIGFRKSFDVAGARTRIDEFRNQYGFCRNIAFVGLTATVLLGWKASIGGGDHTDWYLAAAASLVFVGMFVRFVKFLAAFQAEVIRHLK